MHGMSRKQRRPTANAVYVVRNQLGQYRGKKKRWVDGTEPKKVMLCRHEDEGVNLLVELSAKDIDLRGEVVAVPTDRKGVPRVEPSEYPIAEAEEPAPAETPQEDGGDTGARTGAAEGGEGSLPA